MTQDRLSAFMSEIFMHAIGDIVVHKCTVNALRFEAEANGPKQQDPNFGRVGVAINFIVIERILQECHGGVQPQYRVRSMTSPETVLTMMDHELLPWSDGCSALLANVKMRESGSR